MKHTLKFEMNFESEDIEHDETTPIKNTSIRVFIDDNVIGCLQHLKLEADKNETVPFIEFTFPDLESLDDDNTKSIFIREIADYIKILSACPNIRIIKKNIDDNESPVTLLEEIGTDGFIDSIPMKRRNI